MQQLDLFDYRKDYIFDRENQIAHYYDILSETRDTIIYSEHIDPKKGFSVCGMDYEEQIKTNYFWINSIVNANKYNESIERIFYLDKVINQITFTEIKKLAKKYFDDTYFETLQLLEE